MLLVDHQDFLNAFERADLNRAQVARRAKVTRQFIWQLTSGQKTSCTEEVAQAIEAALGVAPFTLFRYDGSESPPSRQAVA